MGYVVDKYELSVLGPGSNEYWAKLPYEAAFVDARVESGKVFAWFLVTIGEDSFYSRNFAVAGEGDVLDGYESRYKFLKVLPTESEPLYLFEQEYEEECNCH